MISLQKIIFLKQLVAAAQESLFSLEQASELADTKKFNEIKQELLQLNKEIEEELTKLKENKN